MNKILKIILEAYFRVFIQFPLILLGLLKILRDIKDERRRENDGA